MISCKSIQKYVFGSIIIALLLSGCGSNEDETLVGAENRKPSAGMDYDDGETDKTDEKNQDAQAEPAEQTVSEFDVVDYPFHYDVEGWRLVLCRKDSTEKDNTCLFRLYDATGDLAQEFPCDLEAEKFTFRFDRWLYNSWASLAVFPADAETSHADGLVYAWDYEGQRFVEEPIEIPWYEEVNSDYTFLVMDRQENVETKAIMCIDSEIGQAVELRRWTLTWTGEDDGQAELYIWDCMEETVIYDGVLYDGEPEWKALGKLSGDEYFQDLFRKDLHAPRSISVDETIRTAKYILDSENSWGYDLENIDYESRETLLADCGFQCAEPFYQYYDRFGNLELELYFDESAGRGCGFQYSHAFNHESQKIVWCNGFIFEGISTEEWEDDTYSLLTCEGRDAREEEDATQVNYEYTGDGKLSYYEVRGITYLAEAQWGEGMKVTDEFLLSIDWVYRSDGTLYRKYYNHNSMMFATTGQYQWVYYDEQGRPVYRHEYITHGSYDYYYIYVGENEKPSYCLSLDQNGGDSIPVMAVCK